MSNLFESDDKIKMFSIFNSGSSILFHFIEAAFKSQKEKPNVVLTKVC